MIPRAAHFVFGLHEQAEPFHFLHYASLESCRRVLEPETIYFHHKHRPWGPWWERVQPYLTLVEVDLVPEVLAADYSQGLVPGAYRYAHHSDFVRLDALLAHGGVYADIDTIFVRPFPVDLFDAPFVIGREPAVRDERSGEMRPSLCNALMMSEPGAPFASAWRERMAASLNGTWNNHSGFLSDELSRQMSTAVRVEPEVSFFSFPPTQGGLVRLLEERHTLPVEALSVHLWAHLWWDRERRDFSPAHGGWCRPAFIRAAQTTFAELARPYLPRHAAPAASGWSYLSLDEDSGYGVAAERCLSALEDSGLRVEWAPFVPGGGWGLGYQPVPGLREPRCPVVVVHLLPEYLPLIRERQPDAFLVAHTAWETDRIPEHWVGCLDAADLVVVPSRQSAEAISVSPVRTPVAVVPHVAAQVTGQMSPSWTGVPADVFVFYTIAEWNERKAVFKTVEAYLRAFTGRDRVLLIVKTSHRDRTIAQAAAGRFAEKGTTAWALARLIAGHPDPPAVKLVTRSLTQAEIAGLHHRGDCFVSLCRSEGWGLGAFDAAAHGNPVVTTGFGGHLDFLHGSPYLVEFKLTPVEDPQGFPSYAPDQRWADPDTRHGASLLRQVAADQAQARSVAAALAEDIRWRYRPSAIASAFRSTVAQHHLRGSQRGEVSAATRP
jgi:glycosyltransferase involved in cell wall biosynthesis